jgi:hypothetical protein
MMKNTIKEEPKTTKTKVPLKGGNIVTRTVGSVMSGSFLTRDGFLKNLPFVFFLTLLALCYISNGYYAEEQIRRLNKLQYKLKELRSEYIVSNADLAFASKQSEVARNAAKSGIKESLEPPKKIRIEVKEAKPAEEK